MGINEQIARRLAACGLVALAFVHPARAQTADDDTMAEAGQATIAPALPEPFSTWNGARPALEARGVSFAFTYLSDSMRTLGRGGRQGATYMGRFEALAEADLDKLLGWRGARFHIGGFLIHGVGLTHHYLRNFAPVSDLEAASSLRFNDIWIEQKIGDKLSLRVGRLAADSEFFFYAPSSSLPVGGVFGWAPIFALNLPNGGPAYPFAWPGARLRYEANANFALQLGVFDGDAVGRGARDPDVRDRHNVRARLSAPLVIGEAQFKHHLPFFGGLSGQIRIGGWRHFGAFDDPRLDRFGSPLASPASMGAALRHRGDYGVYGVFDQQAWRPADAPDKGVFIWARVAGAPANRNLIDFYVDGGVNVVGLVPGRPSDKFGLTAVYARVSSSARAADRDARAFRDWTRVVRDAEALIEATYMLEVAPGFALQPHVQYILHPGGSGRGAAPGLDGRIKPASAATIGLRASIKY